MCGPAYRGRAQGVTQKVGSSARWIETENRVEAHYTFVLAETVEVDQSCSVRCRTCGCKVTASNVSEVVLALVPQRI